MAVLWSLLLAIPASWGIGLALARMVDRTANMLPAVTILGVFAVLGAAAVLPWAAAPVRLRLMQGLALASLLLMVVLAD